MIDPDKEILVGMRSWIRAFGPHPAGALCTSVGSQARLGANFRPLPPEGISAFISNCY